MNIKQKTIASMKGIAIDSINQATQGHIGMAVGAAPITYSLIGENLNFINKDPKWINRDRFIMSAGHGSMSMYSIMHFMGLLSIDDMKKHKQLHSKTPSHPEIDALEFVDATTGPLGQGVAMGVGMSISQKYLQEHFNIDGHNIVDHNIYVLHGDGCMQEGVALEAIQLAGTLKLNNLILIHDYNNMQIDSSVPTVNNTNWEQYFKSQNFNVFIVDDCSVDNINAALAKARASQKPSYVQIKTIIAKDTEVENQPKGHHGVLTVESTKDFKTKIGLNNFAPFEYDKEVYKHAQKLWDKKEKTYQQWLDLKQTYQNKYPEKWKQLEDIYQKKTKLQIDKNLAFEENNVATRNYIVPIMNELEKLIGIVGGSADLAAATKVKFSKAIAEKGQNIQYGVREFSMAAINNGIYLHSNLRTIDATFLVFADYCKAALRLGAIMEIPAIHLFTHDSYQVGGDGPTHQPVEQLAMLRAIPNVEVIRPCDQLEMLSAFNRALKQDNKQTIIIGCRQPIKSYLLCPDVMEPAYKILKEPNFEISLLASGSEVELAEKVAINLLTKHKIKAQVLSVPIIQSLVNNEELIQKLSLDKKPIYVIEASNDSLWYQLSKYQKIDVFQAEGFGHSAPGPNVYELKGYNVENISKKVLNFLKK